MAQQTAIDFFFTKVLGSLHISTSKTDIDKLLIEAKKMEMEQIVKAYIKGGVNDFYKDEQAEQYYNETYGK